MQKVDLIFGGQVATTNVPAAWTTYEEIATTYGPQGLEPTRHGFIVLYNPSGANDIVGVDFKYQLNGLAEASLGTFNTMWNDIVALYNIEREDTTIRYYEE